MENNQINNSGSCRKYYKCILTTVAITTLAASTTYLLFQNNGQKEIIRDHAREINELKSVINNNHLMVNFNDHLNSVFNDRWFSFRKFFSDMENQISKFHYGVYKNNLNEAINIMSNEQEYVVTAALPGFSKEEIVIKLSGNDLEISTRHTNQDTGDKEENKDTLGKQAQNHIKYGVTVPANIEQNKVTAQFNNGLLTIRFPRIINHTPVEPKEILID